MIHHSWPSELKSILSSMLRSFSLSSPLLTHLDHFLPHYDHHFTSLSPSGGLSTIHREHTYRKHKNTAGKVETHRNMKIHEMTKMLHEKQSALAMFTTFGRDKTIEIHKHTIQHTMSKTLTRSELQNTQKWHILHLVSKRCMGKFFKWWYTSMWCKLYSYKQKKKLKNFNFDPVTFDEQDSDISVFFGCWIIKPCGQIRASGASMQSRENL